MNTRNARRATISRRTSSSSPSLAYYGAATLICCVLVAGFFLAARQHFTSMDFAHKNSRLRRQLDELQSEKRRLMLSKETASSPAEVRRAAMRIKHVDASRSESSVARGGNPVVEKIAARTADTTGPGSKNSSSKVIPAVSVRPVIQPARADRQARLDIPRNHRDRT